MTCVFTDLHSKYLHFTATRQFEQLVPNFSVESYEGSFPTYAHFWWVFLVFLR